MLHLIRIKFIIYFIKKVFHILKFQIKNFIFYLFLLKKNEIFIFNKNFFYENWNNVYENDLIEFILPLENIEIIQNINKNKNNLINLEYRKFI